MPPNADTEALIQIGWWIHETYRPKGMSDYEWESERILTVKLADMEGGLNGNYADKVVPLFAKKVPPNDSLRAP